MTYSEVVQALKSGEVVHWNNPSYKAYLIQHSETLYLKHEGNGSVTIITGYEGENYNFYVEDGTPECTMYRGAFLFYDYIMNEWNVDIMKEIEGVQEIIFKAYYNSLEEAKAGVDEFMRGNTKN